jgi:F-type H+-transporting ATPase subunit b
MLLLGANALIKVTPGLMIWTIICFLIALFVLKRYAFGPIQGAIDKRRERIRESIEEADRAREEARKLLEEHRKLIGQAKSDAEAILAEARKQSDAQRERVREETEEDRQRRLEDTKKQIAAETQRSLDQIRTEVADLTLIATSKVTGKVLDRDDQKKLIEDAISSSTSPCWSGTTNGCRSSTAPTRARSTTRRVTQAGSPPSARTSATSSRPSRRCRSSARSCATPTSTSARRPPAIEAVAGESDPLVVNFLRLLVEKGARATSSRCARSSSAWPPRRRAS